ncbi:MAG: hypothetical protein WCF85_21770 [Rhodospirillaceae bacterium]
MNANTRNLIRRIVSMEGWAALPPRRVRAMVITEIGNGLGGIAALSFLDRLRQAPELLLQPENFDLLPPDIQAKISAGAERVLKDCGVQVERFKDETGQTFLRLHGIERLGIPDNELARMNALADNPPTPVGQLHRVH